MKIQKMNLAGEVVFEYEGEVLSREANAIVIEAFFGREDVQLVNSTLKRGDRFVEKFYTDRWYNVFRIQDREDGTLKGWYCNMGKPAVISKDTVSYIDLALDLWVTPDGIQMILDEDELEGLNLSDEIKQQVYQGLADLQMQFRTNNPPV